MNKNQDIQIIAKLNKPLMTKIANKESERQAKAVAVTALAIAISTAPRDSGNLAASHYIKVSGNSFEVGNTAEHAPYVNAMPQSMIKNGKRAQWLTYALEEAFQRTGLKSKSTGREL